jgi:uncharacterized membrane protein (DUF373 family)
MGRNQPTYAPKAPRGRPHNFAARLFDYVEDGIYVVVAIFLIVAGVLALVATVTTVARDIHQPPLTILTDILDEGLLLFIIAELLHTVRATIQERTLVVEPFLIVGLIAGVRRLLLLTAQLASGTSKFQWNPEGIETVVLVGLILGMTVALVLYHRFHGPGTTEDDS